MSDEKKGTTYTNAVERAIDILEFMAGCGRPVSVVEISKEFMVNRTSIYSILKVLINKGYIRKIEEGRYALTGRMFEYGQKFRNSFPVVHIARAVAATFRSNYPCTMNIAMHFNGNNAILMNSINIAASESYRIDRSMASGQSVPLHATSLGKLLLAYMPPAESKEIIQHLDFQPYTEHTVKNYADLKKQMDFAVANGFVMEENEYYYNTFCVAAPIFDQTNNVVAACSLSYSTLFSNVDREKVVTDVKYIAKNVSIGLGATKRL